MNSVTHCSLSLRERVGVRAGGASIVGSPHPNLSPEGERAVP